MANPLESGSISPPAPLQDAPQNQSAQNGLQGQPQAQQAPPPPTHEQTVAALRHFDAIKGELTPLLANPALGKSDLKSQIIDGVTKLVSERIISAATAVQQLSQVPTDPLQQRKYLQNMMAQTVQAANAIVDHHAQGSLGSMDWAHEGKYQAPHHDDHMDHMKALGAQYGGR
jgi:hypothetical protein